MKVNDLVIVGNLGELKVYKANPRDLEAEAGLKPQNIKLDLINAIDYVESHWKVNDIVTDEAGRFKADAGKMGGSIGERHGIEQKIEEDVIKAVAEDISNIIAQNNPPKYFLALPQNIFKRVWEKVSNEAKDKLFRYIEEDLTKADKTKIPQFFKENFGLATFTDSLLDLISNFKLKDLLYSDTAWNFITDRYKKDYEYEAFIDFFWTIRNMHIPLWVLFRDLEEMPDVKIVHSPSTGYAGFFAGLLKLKTDVPYILTEHGIYTRERKIDLLSANWYENIKSIFLSQENLLKNLWNDFYVSIGRFCYLTSDKILSLYNRAREIQIEYGAPEEKTEVIPNGVNVKRLKEALEKRDKEIPKVIGLIGRVVPIKDIKTFIKAIKIVSNTIPEIEAWIVGPTEEEPEYYKECLSLVEILGLEKNVKFLGFQNILDIFPKIAINTLTSISEGMPLSVLEGFAAGVPAVTTDVGSCKDLIYGALNEEDKKIGNAGFVCKVADPKDLANRYIELLLDEDLWKKTQKSALERVNKFYTQEMFLDNYRRLYNEVINGRD